MASIKIKVNCYHCDNEFERGKYDINRTLKNSGAVFCSIKCSKDYNNKKILEKGFPENKTCSKCNIEKPRTNEFFSKHSKTLDQLDSWCKPCRSAYRNEFRRGLYRDMISDEDLTELLKTESCTICGSKEKLVVDHDHKENFVRGMLCNHCNRGLGHFRDDPDLLEFARIYLLANSKEEEDIKEYNEYIKTHS
jgi:peptide methionine sulfoxide reductase MsrB